MCDGGDRGRDEGGRIDNLEVDEEGGEEVELREDCQPRV